MSTPISYEKVIADRGLVLPEVSASSGPFVPAKTIGSLVYLSGTISKDESGAVIEGTCGADRTIEEGYVAARACALAHLAELKHYLGSLDVVKEIVSVNGWVNSVNGFPDSPKVINGYSDLLEEVFGAAGKHVRAAIGVNALPKNALVEVQMVVLI